MTPSLLEVLDRCPPFLVYYCGHLVTGKRLTVRELIKASGLSPRTFTRTKCKLSWANVKLKVMDRFCRTCSVDPMNPEPLFQALAAEMESPNPFKELEGHCRKQMMAKFNLLSARAAMEPKRR